MHIYIYIMHRSCQSFAGGTGIHIFSICLVMGARESFTCRPHSWWVLGLFCRSLLQGFVYSQYALLWALKNPYVSIA